MSAYSSAAEHGRAGCCKKRQDKDKVAAVTVEVDDETLSRNAAGSEALFRGWVEVANRGREDEAAMKVVEDHKHTIQEAIEVATTPAMA